jgi:hypothetical protein
LVAFTNASVALTLASVALTNASVAFTALCVGMPAVMDSAHNKNKHGTNLILSDMVMHCNDIKSLSCFEIVIIGRGALMIVLCEKI